jgi:putative ABC transport system permease protein
MNMFFILKMAVREIRSSWRRLAFFFVCVAVGVGAIVALRSVIQNVRGALAGEARTLIAADVYIRARQPFTEETLRTIDEQIERHAVEGRTETMDLATMARPADERKASTKVVELRAVQRGFPFYGQVVLASGRPFSRELLAGRGVLVGPELPAQLGVEIGEDIVIGQVTFTIRDVILTEPGRRLGAFSFGPRILVDYDDLQQTGLVGFASRAERQILLKVGEGAIGPLVSELRQTIGVESASIGSYRRAEDRISDNLERAENYLSLIGFVVLILGGVGVWSVTRVFVQQRLRSIATLKCLGATSTRVLWIYVLQIVTLALGGSVLGVLLARMAIAAIPEDMALQAAAAAGLSGLSYGLTASAVGQGVLVGLLVSLLFAVVPLLDVRQVKPLLLLRHGLAGAGSGYEWRRYLVITAASGALVLVAAWQAASLEVGLHVCAGFAGVTLVLHVVARYLVRAIRPLERASWFPLRHAVLNLSRPGNQTRVILVAVGLGSFFIIGIRALEANLLRSLALELREDSPDMFLIDIQEDQAQGLRELLQARLPAPPALVPVLRARVSGVEGRQLRLEGAQAVRREGLGREYVITYRHNLEDNERIIDGRFWGAGTEAGTGGAPIRGTEGPEVSVEQGIRDDHGIQVGDTIRFDILGRTIAAQVTSVRAVDWDDSRSGGFIFVFRPGSLEGAPHTYISFMKGPAEAQVRARLQRDIVAAFPNVSVIDALEILKTVRRVLDYVTLAISIVGGIAFLSGALILMGSVAMTKFQRLYEAAIFRTLGASTKTLATMLLLEYGTLGTLAGIIGSTGALVLTWTLSRWVLDIAWYAAPAENLAGIALTALMVAIVGVAASVDVLRRKPLATLRAE